MAIPMCVGQPHCLSEESDNLVMAFVVTSEWAASRDVPTDVGVQNRQDFRDIATTERGVSAADQFDVLSTHFDLPEMACEENCA